MDIKIPFYKSCPGNRNRKRHQLPADDKHFSRNKSRSDGFAPYCRVCAAEIQREWKRQNADKVKAAKQAYMARKRAEREAARD